MRLTRLDIDKSFIVKLDRSVREDGVNGIMTYGKKNDYPQVIESIVNNSVTGKSVTKIYSKFLTGQGFENEVINTTVIGRDNRGKKITARELLSQIALSFGYHNGSYIHCNLTMEAKVKNVKLIPFKFCRFAKIDDKGYTAKIGVYDNWSKENGMLQPKKIVWYNIFNLDAKIVAGQIKKADSIEKYKGQVYFCFFDNSYLYPLAPLDPVYMDADTEYQLQLFKNRSIRNGMMDKTVLRVEAPSNEEERTELKEGIKQFIGPDGDSLMVLEDEVDPATGEIKSTGAFKIDQIKSNINSRLFESWERDISNNIRKSMSAIPAILIDYEESKLGTTSGEAIIQATNFYNAMTQDDRSKISDMFKELFENSAILGMAGNTNWKIKPLNLYDNGATSDI